MDLRNLDGVRSLRPFDRFWVLLVKVTSTSSVTVQRWLSTSTGATLSQPKCSLTADGEVTRDGG